MDDRSERLRKRRNRSGDRGADSDAPAESSGSDAQAESSGSDASANSGQTPPETESTEATNQSEPSGSNAQSHGAQSTGDRADGDEENGAEDSPVKESQVGTYMYLPESQTREMRRLYNVLKAEYEFAYDDDFEKNRHFYPLIVEYGLDSLDGLDVSEIRERLDEYYD